MHRVTGVLMVILLPFLLWAFSLSQGDSKNFFYVQMLLTNSAWSVLAWIFLSAVSYHLVAGIRHLIMDFGFGETMVTAKLSSVLILILSGITTIFWGLWLWLI